MKKHLLLLISGIAIFSASYAQQVPQYSQYMINDYILNPAVTGKNDYYEAKSNNRYMWAGIDEAPRTYILSVHGPFKTKNMGLGGNVFADITGPTSRVGANLSYGYHIKLTENAKLSFGLSGGILQFKIDGTKITLRQNGDPALINAVQSVIVPDASFGTMIYNDKYFFGISATQLIGNKLKFFEKQSPINSTLDRHFLINGGYKIPLGESFGIEPSFLVKYVNPVPLQVDLGLRVIYRDQIWLGGAYRMKDAVSAMVGFTYKDYLIFGYAYDYAMSNLNSYSNGTHEIMIGARFNRYRGAN